MPMCFNKYKQSATLLLSGLLMIAAFSTGCTSSFLPTLADASNQKDDKVCTCSLKEQVKEFVVARSTDVNNHHTSEFDTSSDEAHVLTFESAPLAASHSPPSLAYNTIAIPEPTKGWPVLLARAHL